MKVGTSTSPRLLQLTNDARPRKAYQVCSERRRDVATGISCPSDLQGQHSLYSLWAAYRANIQPGPPPYLFPLISLSALHCKDIHTLLFYCQDLHLKNFKQKKSRTKGRLLSRDNLPHSLFCSTSFYFIWQYDPFELASIATSKHCLFGQTIHVLQYEDEGAGKMEAHWNFRAI